MGAFDFRTQFKILFSFKGVSILIYLTGAWLPLKEVSYVFAKFSYLPSSLILLP